MQTRLLRITVTRGHCVHLLFKYLTNIYCKHVRVLQLYSTRTPFLRITVVRGHCVRVLQQYAEAKFSRISPLQSKYFEKLF